MSPERKVVDKRSYATAMARVYVVLDIAFGHEDCSASLTRHVIETRHVVEVARISGRTA